MKMRSWSSLVLYIVIYLLYFIYLLQFLFYLNHTHKRLYMYACINANIYIYNIKKLPNVCAHY